MKFSLKHAIDSIRNGAVAIFPTDTAFGIGCRIDNEESVKRLFAIKQRSETQATPVLVNSADMACKYFSSVSSDIKNLMETYWPGALTIVGHCEEERVSSLIRGGTNTIGLRMPNHDIPLEIIDAIGVPIIGTSANFHGEKTPFSFEELNDELVRKVDIVIPGECFLHEASTIVDATITPWKILRQGAITIHND